LTDGVQKAETKAVEEGEEVHAKLEQAISDKKQLEDDAFQVTKVPTDTDRVLCMVSCLSLGDKISSCLDRACRKPPCRPFRLDHSLGSQQ
jgi:hypothetical protein